MTNLLTRNSPRELTTPIPSKDEMHEIYQAALRAPDHAWLRPSRFIEVSGAGLDKLSKVFTEFATNELKDVTPLQMEKYEAAPFRAPMVIILTTQITEHPKVPKVEQCSRQRQRQKISCWHCMPKTMLEFGERVNLPLTRK